MNSSDYIILGLAAAVLGYVVYRQKTAIVADPTINTRAPYGAQEIQVDPEAANGWKYYTDGTAIGPDGKYYYQGVQVYDPNAIYGQVAQVSR